MLESEKAYISGIVDERVSIQNKWKEKNSLYWFHETIKALTRYISS